MVRINKLAPAGVNVFVKVEAFNPMGSVKDRLALGVIEDAERRGALKPGQTVVEATSGNTGIGLAMVCAQKGYPLVVTMAENFSVERRTADALSRRQGGADAGCGERQRHAGEGGGTGRDAWLVSLPPVRERGQCRYPFARPPRSKSSTTSATSRLDYWVSGMGTGGTLKGVARVLKQESPDTRIIVCEPDNSPILGSGVRQARAADGTPSVSHPYFRPHLMQGWTPDFIPKLAEDAARCRAGRRDRAGQGRRGAAAARARWRRRRASSPAFRAARPSPAALGDRRARAAGRQHPVHAAGHRRTLSLDAAVRGHRRPT